jgi:hypothetical protein
MHEKGAKEYVLTALQNIFLEWKAEMNLNFLAYTKYMHTEK